MTTIPVHLPRMITGALEVGASVKVDPITREGRAWMVLAIIWADKSITHHEWRQGIDAIWSHKGPGRIQDTRARIEREARDGQDD